VTTSHQYEIAFVVVFNLTRFARDKYDHFALRSLLQSLGISLRSVTEPIDDTSTGKLMEGRARRVRAVRQRLSLWVRSSSSKRASGAILGKQALCDQPTSGSREG